MKLPVLISVPHAGLKVPGEVAAICFLTQEDIAADSDGGAGKVYDIEKHVEVFATTHIARAIVDLNREEDDRSPDGVIKTQTIYGAKVYTDYPPEPIIEVLLSKYYRPYHARLSGSTRGLMLGIDCHTMAAKGPSRAGDSGEERPLLSIGDNGGRSIPLSWRQKFVFCMEEAFQLPVAVNRPFRGGYITSYHSREMPWVQLEMSRAPFYGADEKRERLLRALFKFCCMVKS